MPRARRSTGGGGLPLRLGIERQFGPFALEAFGLFLDLRQGMVGRAEAAGQGRAVLAGEVLRVPLRLGTGVVGFTGEGGRVIGVRLATDEVLPADVVVAAIGATPATEWLADSGLELDNGVVCDSRCRTGEGIFAVADVARRLHEGLGRLVRLENRTNATEQSMKVAGAILSEDRPCAPVPYFWTDQYDAKLQVHGFLPADAEVEFVESDLTVRHFVAATAARAGSPASSDGTCPRQTRLRRQEIVDGPGAPASTPAPTR